MPVKRPPQMTEWEWLVFRFWKGVLKREPNECWPWLKATVTDGYGTIALRKGVPFATHRLSYEIHNGPLPKGAIVRHRCGNHSCCNPNHLQLGDHIDNMRDKAVAGDNKLMLEDYERIRVDGRSQRAIAEAYGISQSMVSLIKSRKRGVIG